MTIVPAWLNSTVTGPNFSLAPFTAAWTWASSETSATKCSATPPARADRRGGLGGRFAIAVDDRHLGAFGGEQFRGRPAHPRRAARNDGNLASQSSAHFQLPLSCLAILHLAAMLSLMSLPANA